MTELKNIDECNVNGREKFVGDTVWLRDFFTEHGIKDEKEKTKLFLSLTSPKTLDHLKKVSHPVDMESQDFSHVSHVLNKQLTDTLVKRHHEEVPNMMKRHIELVSNQIDRHLKQMPTLSTRHSEQVSKVMKS